MPAKFDKPINPMLLTDFYKVCHKAFYNNDISQLISYWTPRKSRLAGIDDVVVFGLQAFAKKYLIDYFNVNFFEKPWEENEKAFCDVIGASLDEDIAKYQAEAFRELWELGYLPIEICALPEGTLVPIGCPAIQFKCTKPEFFWVAEYFETLTSCNIWFPMTDATIAYHSRKILDKFYDLTAEDSAVRCMGAGNFSMRGMTSVESAPMGDAGHLLSFESTATIPTLWWLHCFYNTDFTAARGTPSTEHSVMESYRPENEFEAYRRLVEDIKPNGNLSIVSDTWDLWNVVTNYLPRLKDSILKRDGKIIIRPDSGDPVDILCGKPDADGKAERTPEDKGLIELLWEVFGGTVNSKGHKVLDPHIGAIYGDAITHEREREIFTRLMEKGFAANNVVLGFGSYTYQLVTRDTFGFALKVTAGTIDGEEVELFKDPITDKGPNSAGKKSQKGVCVVYHDEHGNIKYQDGYRESESAGDARNLLRPMFRDGELLVDEHFDTIRNRLHPNF